MECPRIEATIDMYMIYSPEEEQCVCPAANSLPEGVTCISPSESVAQLESQYNINMDSREDVRIPIPPTLLPIGPSLYSPCRVYS